MSKTFFCVVLTLSALSISGFESLKHSKLVIDNDAGGDDAMAIFLALLYEKHCDGPKLVALTTGNGNTLEDNVYVNNQRILKVAARQDVPIYRGSKSSIVKTPTVINYYGVDGLGDNDDSVEELAPAKEQNAVSALIKLSKEYEGDLVVVTIGTLTNIALAIKLDPDFLGRLGQLYIAAGHIHSDENPEPEFNAKMDVEAYHIVAQNANPDKVTILPFSQTLKYLDYSKEWRETVLGAIDTEIIRAQNKYERVSLDRSDRWLALDPAMVAMVIKPDLVEEFKYAKNDIVLCDEERGINTNTFVDKEEANVRVIFKPKHDEYKQFLIDVFSADKDED